MGNIVIHIGTAQVNMTGMGLMDYADHYYQAARLVTRSGTRIGFDPVPYQLYCQALELRLKAYIWLTDPTLTRLQLKNRYGHNLARLWLEAKQGGLGGYARITPQRDSVVALVAPYYKDRKFCYTDIAMTFRGYRDIQAQPDAHLVLARLVAQLGRTLRKPIISAS